MRAESDPSVNSAAARCEASGGNGAGPPDPDRQLRFEQLPTPEQNRGRVLGTGSPLTDQLLKAEEMRQILNVSRSWLYEAANAARIPSIRLGPDGPLRFDPAAIERWLQRRGDDITRTS